MDPGHRAIDTTQESTEARIVLLSLSFFKVSMSLKVDFKDAYEVLLDSVGQISFDESLLLVFISTILLSSIKSELIKELRILSGICLRSTCRKLLFGLIGSLFEGLQVDTSNLTYSNGMRAVRIELY